MTTTDDNPSRYLDREQGFTLIEILVAVLILSLGVLGLVGMESLALKNNLSAYHRSQATLLAYDLSDRMRANPAGVAASEYISAFSPVVSYACVSYGGTASVCNPQQIAKNDIFEWSAHLLELLPAGSGALASSVGIQTVTIRWDDDRDGVANQTFTYSFGL